MRKIVLYFFVIATAAMVVSSCGVISQNSYGGCPSHDKNFFRKN